METMIALAVMTVLITGFLAVFGPATGSIRRSLSIEEANRLQSTLERELGAVRPGKEVTTYPTSFEKAFAWIMESHTSGKAVILYKYKGDPKSPRDDGTLKPFEGAGEAGKDFLVQPMARRVDDLLLEEDMEASVGRAYFVTMTQLVENGGKLELGTVGQIQNPGGGAVASAALYTDAVIAFEAGFHDLPTNSLTYIKAIDPADSQFENPSFTRNIGVRR